MATKRTRATGNPRPSYPELSVSNFQHPADRAATAALSAIPGLDTVVRWLIEQGYERAFRQQTLAGSVLLGPKQLSGAWDSLLVVSETLDLPDWRLTPPAMYVIANAELNAMAVGAHRPYIVLTSRLVEVLTPGELRAVIGHEVGHILADHVLYRTAMQILLSVSLPALGPGAIPLAAIRLALLEWFRSAELTCDRAAVLAVDDPDLVCQTMMVLGGGLPSSTLSYDAFRDQMRAFEDWGDGPDRLRRFLASLQQTHSSPVRRAAEIQSWVASGEYERIRSGQYTRRGEEPANAAAADAVAHYTDRFRDVMSAAGESVVRVGSRLQAWLQSDGSDDEPAADGPEERVPAERVPAEDVSVEDRAAPTKKKPAIRKPPKA